MHRLFASALPLALRWCLAGETAGGDEEVKTGEGVGVGDEVGEGRLGAEEHADARSDAGAADAASALREALVARGRECVLEELVGKSADCDLALTIAAALGVGPDRACEHARKAAYLAEATVRTRLVAQLGERRDLLTCTRVARRLGLEWELVRSALLDEIVSLLHARGYLQMLQQIGDVEARARDRILDALVVREEYAAAARLAARWDLRGAATQWGWEELGELDKMLRVHNFTEALEYAGDNAVLRKRVASRMHGAAGAGARGGQEMAGAPTSEAKCGTSGGLACARLGKAVEVVWVGDAAGVEACWNALKALQEGLGAQGTRDGARAGGYVGLDCEWRHPRPVSLVQVATADKVLLRPSARWESRALCALVQG